MTAEAAVPSVLARRPRARPGLPAPLAGLSRWIQRRYVHPEMPNVAVEFRPFSVGVVRVRRERGGLSLHSAASIELPAGALVPSLVQPNVADPERVRAALRAALERCGVLDGARAAVVLPDPAARVSLVPDVDLSGKRGSEAEDLLRFRLRKSLPFDVREARLGWATVGTRGGDPAVVVAALRSVVEGYEAVCQAAALEPGLVEIAALTLARAAFPPETSGDRLLVNWEDGYASLVVARGDWPVLVRTLSGVAATPGELSREVSSTLTYYRERLGGAGLTGVVVRTTAAPAAEAVTLLQAAAGAPATAFDPLAALGGGAGHAAGAAVAGAAAALGPA